MRWEMVTLNDLRAEEPRAITDGPFGSYLARQHYTDSGPRVVRLQNIGDGVFLDARAHISDDHFRSLRGHEVRGGDLLIASLGEVLPRACLAPQWLGPAIVKADCIRVRLRTDVDPRWVMYSMQRPAVRRWADDQRHGVGRPRLGLKAIRQIPVPLPSPREQRRIVDILEDHLSRLDAADRSVDVAGQRAARLLLAHLSQRVGQLRGDGVPMVAIGDVARTSLGKMLDAKRAEGELTPYLANINVRWGNFDLAGLKEVRLTTQERERLTLEPGDVLACEGGEPGRCAVWRLSGSVIAYQKALHRVRVHDADAVSPHFLALMLREAVQSGRSATLFTGTTIKHLPQEKVRRIRVPIPSPEVQTRIVTEADRMTGAAGELRGSLVGAMRRSAALRRALLAAAFSGRLTGRHSDQEVVEELVDE